MLQLIIGGTASGKSAFAEQLVQRAGDSPRYYIATMQPLDEESEARIQKHRRMRSQKGFQTIECYTDLQSVVLPRPGVALLECMSNLTANELYSPQGAGESALETIMAGVEALQAQCEQLIVVSNDVFCGGAQYAGDTERYLRKLAAVNRMLAAQADCVIEVVCGIPYYYKGEAT